MQLRDRMFTFDGFATHLALIDAARAGDLAGIVTARANGAEAVDSALVVAAANGHSEAMRKLKELGAVEWEEALRAATRGAHLEAMNTAGECGASNWLSAWLVAVNEFRLSFSDPWRQQLLRIAVLESAKRRVGVADDLSAEIADRRRSMSRRQHQQLLDMALALLADRAMPVLPPYVLLWISDWVGVDGPLSEAAQVALLENIAQSRRGVWGDRGGI